VPPSIREYVALGPLTTLGVGGPARWFADLEDEAGVVTALGWARKRGLSTLVIGGGSNLLVADRGVDALVLRVRLRGITEAPEGAVVRVDAAAGEAWDDLIVRAVERGFAGLECLSGIPGAVGATPIQNVGAYGQEVSETITRVRAIERATGAVVDFDNRSCGFGYRDSIFKREAQDRFVLTQVSFALRPGGAATVRYAELTQRLATLGIAAPSLAAVRAAVLELRRGKSMLFDPADENGRSAGSFFMNPTLTAEAFAEVEARSAAGSGLRPGESVPRFPAPLGRIKVPAAWLIERAGFTKGAGKGRVGLSTRHTLAIVNRGGATASEVLAFAKQVRALVLERFGVGLCPEPVMWGFAREELEGLGVGPVEKP
jgi:UDP-N-acetylmuramate dehydrogenase